jgi:hypothetical protein
VQHAVAERGQAFLGSSDDLGYQSAALSTDGALVLMAYLDAVSQTSNELHVTVVPSNISTDWSGFELVTADFDWWQTASIDANRFALAYSADTVPHPLRLQVVTATSIVANPGMTYDVTCSLPISSVLGVGTFNNQLGFLAPTGSGADFYVCSIPP